MAERIRQRFGEDAAKLVARIAMLLDEDDPQVVLAAAKILFERGWGRPMETVDLTVHRADWDLSRLTAADLETLRAIQQKALPGAPDPAQSIIEIKPRNGVH